MASGDVLALREASEKTTSQIANAALVTEAKPMRGGSAHDALLGKIGGDAPFCAT